tara:strand:+ start:10424 stop:11455 length:1032 start_codon:yes stop_codon:yes gene_type:complete
MINFIRNIIINKRSKISFKKVFKKANFSLNRGLSYSIKSFGVKNKNKIFYVINRSPGGGMFSNLNFVIHHLLIAETFNFIPIIDMENFPTLYNEKKKINNSLNAWDYYFESINKYNLKDVYKSKNVIFTNRYTFKNIYFDGFNKLSKSHIKICKKYINFKKEIISESRNFIMKNFKNKKILGVHFRGSDQKTQERHPLPATIRQIEVRIIKLLDEKKLDNFFLVTEEKKYLKYFQKKMGNKLIHLNSFTSNKTNIFDDNPNNRSLHRYKIGKENIINMLCLSHADHLLYVSSNLAEASLFFSKKKIAVSKIDNGLNSSNVFISQFYWYLRKLLPKFLGGFKID